jgi:hypothetical protein
MSVQKAPRINPKWLEHRVDRDRSNDLAERLYDVLSDVIDDVSRYDARADREEAREAGTLVRDPVLARLYAFDDVLENAALARKDGHTSRSEPFHVPAFSVTLEGKEYLVVVVPAKD